MHLIQLPSNKLESLAGLGGMFFGGIGGGLGDVFGTRREVSEAIFGGFFGGV